MQLSLYFYYLSIYLSSEKTKNFYEIFTSKNYEQMRAIS